MVCPQVDSVRHMSWQAQVRGRKRWQLAPPPECLYSCRWISFTVEPGEICEYNPCAEALPMTSSPTSYYRNPHSSVIRRQTSVGCGKWEGKSLAKLLRTDIVYQSKPPTDSGDFVTVIRVGWIIEPRTDSRRALWTCLSTLGCSEN